jgi:hypothetical protein
MQIPDRGFVFSGTVRRPAPAEPLIGARRRVARGDGRQGEVDARHHVEWWSRSERTRADPPFGAAARSSSVASAAAPIRTFWRQPIPSRRELGVRSCR